MELSLNWDVLSKKEKAVAEKLGLKPKAKNKKKKECSKVYELIPYNKKVKLKCQLCNTESIDYYTMEVKNFPQSHLTSKVVKFEQLNQSLKTKTHNITVNTCNVCKESLKNWSKEKLIFELIKKMS